MDGLLILCLALLLVAVGLKFKTIIDLRRATREHTEVITERQRLHDVRTQSQMVLDRAEVLERELTNDVRDLVAELADLDRKIERLREELDGDTE